MITSNSVTLNLFKTSELIVELQARGIDITSAIEPTYWVICIKKGYQTGIAKVEVEPGAATPCNFVLRRKVE